MLTCFLIVEQLQSLLKLCYHTVKKIFFLVPQFKLLAFFCYITVILKEYIFYNNCLIALAYFPNIIVGSERQNVKKVINFGLHCLTIDIVR